jgi:superfamily II DNA/RNA helicase
MDLVRAATDETGEDSPVPVVRDKPQALVVVPTRELCVQVTEDLKKAAARRQIRILSVYGGRAYEPQVEALKNGVEVVVGTPGRLIDLYKQKHLSLKNVRIVILDEADEMLDLGFLPDVETLLAATPAVRQTMLFSATMPGAVIAMARRYMTKPTHIRAESPQSSAVHTTTDQFAYRAHALDKVELVSRLLQARGRGATMIFTRTKRTAQKVSDELGERGFKVGAVHGDLNQVAREKGLKSFRTGDIDVLVATDVAARGIDIDDVTHVINYQCPEDDQAYIHRIGRTGRAGRTGVAITLVDWDELARWEMIDKALGLGHPAPAETYSSSPHFYEELDIPTDSTGTVGPARAAKPAKRPARDAAGQPRSDRGNGSAEAPTRSGE